MIAHNHGQAAGGERIGEVPGADARFLRIDPEHQPVDRIARRIRNDRRAHAGQIGEALYPEIEMAALGVSHGVVVALAPGLERRDRRHDALLADLHAAADARILQESRTYEILGAGHNSRRESAHEFMRAVDGDVGTSCEEALEIVLGGEVSDHWHGALMADPREGFERDLAVLHSVVRDNVECSGCALRDLGAQLEILRMGYS